MNFIKKAREAVATYSVLGNMPKIELQQLLGVIIGASATPELTGRLAQYGAEGLVDLSIQELENVGLTHLQALRLHSALLLANKLKKVEAKKRTTIRSPKDGANYMMEEMRSLKQEHFIVLFLNTKNEVVSQQTIFVGSLNSSIVHPREVFREAVRRSSASIICFHNHPSGNPDPSQEDIHVTRRMADAGKLMGVEVLDHIIIGDGKYVSLKEKGFL